MAEATPQTGSPDKVPAHVAIIMDGNNRWARKRKLAGAEGHRAGEQAVQAVIRRCAEQGVAVLTLFAFSSENWSRPDDEVDHLMSLFLRALDERVAELHEHGIQLRFIGDRAAFSPALQQGMRGAEALTRDNTRMTVVVAVNYGGQWDIREAARSIAREVAEGRLSAEQVDDQCLAGRLSLAGLPAPDLLIRTGGERRISNFLLWQAAYTELYFTPVLWPDFDGSALDAALADFAARERRFGGSGVACGETSC